MMTPIYLNPPTSNSFPFADQVKEEHDHHQHLKLFITPHQTTESSCSTFFNTNQDQRGGNPSHDHHSHQHEHKVYNNFWHDELSDRQVLQSSTAGESFSGMKSSNICKTENGDGDSNNNSNGLTVKWMSSKMRMMRKMMNSSNCAANEKQVMRVEQHEYHDHHHHQQQQQKQQPSSTQINYLENGNNGIIRVCSNCNTTKTPLWRGGPCGPKSLCNACGIRQRKARRAMEAAAAATNGTVVDSTTTDTSSSSSSTKKTNYKVINKEKKSHKSRTNYYVAQYKKQCKLQDQDDHHSTNNKLCFEDFALNLLSKNSGFRGVFPQDEEEGAVLLMALSCGLV